MGNKIFKINFIIYNYYFLFPALKLNEILFFKLIRKPLIFKVLLSRESVGFPLTSNSTLN